MNFNEQISLDFWTIFEITGHNSWWKEALLLSLMHFAWEALINRVRILKYWPKITKHFCHINHRINLDLDTFCCHFQYMANMWHIVIIAFIFNGIFHYCWTKFGISGHSGISKYYEWKLIPPKKIWIFKFKAWSCERPQ